jgi:hypothetical protein
MADRSPHKRFTKALAHARRVSRDQCCTVNLYRAPSGALFPSIGEPSNMPPGWLRLANIRSEVDCRPYRHQKMAADYVAPPRQLRVVR